MTSDRSSTAERRERLARDWAARGDRCERGIEDTIKLFRETLPGWWYSLGECEVSCDASCGPTAASSDLALIPQDDRFNSGFHADIPQPSTLAEALGAVMMEAVEARALTGANPHVQ